MNDMPLISCVVPTFNRAEKLVGAIESIVSQTYKYLEILVIDDQSIDDTKETVARLAEKDNRIVYLYNPVKGANQARNYGIQKAKGRFIALLDDDDEWKSQKLEKQYQAFLDNPDAGMVFCAFARTKNEGKSFRRHPSYFSRICSEKIANRILRQNFITTSSILVRKSVFEQVGYFDPTFKSFQDWELLTRIALNFQILYQKEVLVYQYESRDSITKNKKGRLISSIRHLKKYMKLYENEPRLLSSRYSSLGFTLIKLKRPLFARKFLYRSLKYNLLNFEALVLLLYISFKNQKSK